MKTKTGMSIGLALTLMVGVFATMLALGLFTTNRGEAQEAHGHHWRPSRHHCNATLPADV